MLKHYFLALVVTGVTHLILAIFVYLRGPKKLTNVTYACYSATISWWSCLEAFSITASTHGAALILWRLNHVGVIFIPIFFVHFVMSLLEDHERQRRHPLVLGSYAVGIFLLALNATDLLIREVVPKFSFRHFISPGSLYPFFFLGWIAWAVYGLILLFKVYARSRGALRNQMRYFCWSMLIAYIGGAPNFLPTFDIEIPILMPFGTYAIPAYAFVTTYAIVRYRLMDVSVAFTRMALFITVYCPLLVLPFLLGKLSQPLLISLLGSNWWILPMAVEALFAVGGLAAYKYVQQKAEERLAAEQRRYQGVLLQASEGMTLIRDLDRLLGLIVHLLTMNVRVRHAAIYLWDEKSKRFLPKAARHWKTREPPAFTDKDPLIESFRWVKGPLVTEELQHQARGGLLRLQPVVHALKALDAAVLVPSLMEAQNAMKPGRCLGFLLLGEKRSGAIYTPDDLRVFQTLANQAALGIENARFYDELQRTQADLYETKKLVDMGRMAGGMSHQVNNRFHAISVMAEVVKNAMAELGDPSALDSAKLKEWWERTLETFGKIWTNALRGGDIAKKLIKYGKPSSLEFKPIPVTVKEIATIAYELSEGRIDFALIDWTPTIPDGLPSVLGELYPLGDSISNLITNSFDATQQKAEKIQQHQMPRASQDPDPYRGQLKLRVHTEKDDGDKPWVMIEVQDNGVGMTEDELGLLFHPFFTTKATSEKGTGLGLYVIKTIVEKHGGTIGVKSTYGVGTAFTIRLPALAEEGKSHA